MSKKIRDDNEILTLTCKGLSAKEIADKFGCHFTTINKRMAKLGIKPKRKVKKTQDEEKQDILWYNYTNSPNIENRNKLVEANLGLIYLVMQRFCPTIDREELYQEGIFGLIKAIEKFNPDKGNRFSSLAIPWIRGAMLHYLRDRHNLIKSRNKIINLQSLDYEINNEDGKVTTLIETILCEEVDEDFDIKRHMECLDKNHFQAVECYYLKAMDRKTTAKFLGVSPMMITRRLKVSIKLLKEKMLY